MKKFLFIVLFITYGFSSSGITLQFHFCCGKLQGIAWSQEENHSCDHGSMKNLPCCENKYFFIDGNKEYDKHPSPYTDLTWNPAAMQHLQSFPFVQALHFRGNGKNLSQPLSSSHLFILYNAFRI